MFERLSRTCPFSKLCIMLRVSTRFQTWRTGTPNHFILLVGPLVSPPIRPCFRAASIRQRWIVCLVKAHGQPLPCEHVS